MRSLSFNEISDVSGGINCIDKETWQNIQNKAVKDGIVMTAFLSPLVGVAAYALNYVPLTCFGAALYVAPITMAAGFYYSNAWKILG